MSLRDEILSMDDRKSMEVTIPEWQNKTVKVRSFSAGELDSWQQYCGGFAKRNQPVPHMRAKLATLIVIDDNGNHVFSDADVEALSSKNGKAVDRIFDAYISLNKLSEEEIREYEKNS